MNKKEVQREIEYSEEMEDLMGQVPPWFARSGFYALLAVLAIVFTSGYLIPYNEYVELSCKYHLRPVPQVIYAKNNCTIHEIYVSSGDKIKKESTILTIEYRDVLGQDKVITRIKAAQNGIVALSPGVLPDAGIAANHWLATVKPERFESVSLRSETNVSYDKQISIGQKTQMTFPGLDNKQDLLLNGTISSVTEVAGTGRMEIEYKVSEPVSIDTMASYSQVGRSKILIKKSRLINHIFKPANPLPTIARSSQ